MMINQLWNTEWYVHNIMYIVGAYLRIVSKLKLEIKLKCNMRPQVISKNKIFTNKTIADKYI